MTTDAIGLAPKTTGPRARPRQMSSTSYWLKALFGTPLNTLVSLSTAFLLTFAAFEIFGWFFLKATLSGGPDACKLGQGGACWPFLTAKIRFIFFGIYPQDEQWRIYVALAIFFIACGLTMLPRFWTRACIGWWIAAIAIIVILIRGGFFGLAYVPSTQWSGLPLSIMMSFLGFALGLPLGISLALARNSPFPVFRVVATVIIEFSRGVPLITVLFMASVLSPLFMPGTVTVDKLLSAQIPLTIFIGAYIAETVRGGLSSVPQSQFDAANSLGLTYWQSMRFVMLPQALSNVIPPLITLFIAFFQDTTLVTVVGLLDFLSTMRVAIRDPNWQGIAALEGYLVVGVVFFAFSFGLSLYSRFLERIRTRSSERGRNVQASTRESLLELH